MTKRLNVILAEIEPCKCLADVGCDHGLISLMTLQSKKAKKVLATDISQKCLDKTINLLKENNLENFAEFVCVDGLPKSSKPDEVLIAGMGGLEIISILENYFLVNDNRPILVLQPMRDEYKVRKFLNNNNNYTIIEDFIFEDKKLYRLIKAKRGKQNLTESQMFFGVIENEYKYIEFKKYLEKIVEKYTKKLHNTAKNTLKQQKITKILQKCEKLKQI